LLTHTQVLDDDVAFLAEATREKFGDAILDALDDPERARQIGLRARHLAETKYSYEAYLNGTREACAYLTGEGTPQVVGDFARAASPHRHHGEMTTTVTPPTPTGAWRTRSRLRASAGGSGGSSPRPRSG